MLQPVFEFDQEIGLFVAVDQLIKSETQTVSVELTGFAIQRGGIRPGIVAAGQLGLDQARAGIVGVMASGLPERTSGRIDITLFELEAGLLALKVGDQRGCVFSINLTQSAGLLDGSLGFAGEESAGASFLRRDGRVWTTDKDGIVMGLLAAEVAAITGDDPAERYMQITRQHGEPAYARFDAPAVASQREALKRLRPGDVNAKELAGEPVTRVLDQAPGNGAPIGGIKVETQNGWFAARPSGTEDIYKIYAESMLGPDHLRRIQDEAKDLVDRVFQSAGVAS